MPGQNRYAVHVVPYSPAWPSAFENEKNKLSQVLAPHLVAIEHVGSTSIPNQDAKPVIDLFAAVQPLLDEQAYASLLGSSGYRYVETGMTGRHLFVKEAGGMRTHHLHLLPSEGFYERNELLFRDYLRDHPEFVLEYGELKRTLAERYPLDPDGYTRAKTGLIQRVVDLARTERGLPLQNVWDS